MQKLKQELTHTILKPIESLEVIEKLVEETYQEIARLYSEEFGSDPNHIYDSAACQQFVTILNRKLKEHGIDSEYKEYKNKDIKHLVRDSRHHMILESRDYITDGTWQQLLPKSEIKPNAKHCLILSRKSLRADLIKASVPEKLWFIYEVQPMAKAKAA